MAREGADISIVFLPSEQVSAETTKRLVEKENIQCLLIPGDLRDLNFCREAVGKHVAKYSSASFLSSRYTDCLYHTRLSEVNVLVNNASKQYMCKEFSEINLEKIQDVFKTNIIQMVALAKLAVSRRLLRPTYASLMVVIRSYTQRRIKNTSSVVTFRGSGTILDYAVTKGAIIRFTRSLGAHLIPKDIRVNTVA
jgi:NAD(P)-dependent dehydrogenase (short-subunit alcohol dehydrogenase family)